MMMMMMVMMRNFQLELHDPLGPPTDPESGFVGGGRQEQRGGCSFQVWEGDRHVSVHEAGELWRKRGRG